MTTLAGQTPKASRGCKTKRLTRDANQNSQRFLSDVPSIEPEVTFLVSWFSHFPRMVVQILLCRPVGVESLAAATERRWLIGWMDRSSEGKQENGKRLVIMTTVGFKRGVGILAQQTSTNHCEHDWVRWAACEIKAHGRPWPSKVTQSMFSLAEIATYNGMEIIRKRRWTEWLFFWLARNLFEVLLHLQSWHNLW